MKMECSRPQSTRRAFLRDTASTIGLAAGATLLRSSPLPAISAPILIKEDVAFLREQVRRVIAAARIKPGETRGKWKNKTPYILHVPSGDMGYPAFWIRDAAMMLGENLISPEEVEGWIKFISGTIQEPAARRLLGMIIPPYMVPDHIKFDGKPHFFPGGYPLGASHRFGERPPLDDNFYFIADIYEQWKLAKSLRFFDSPIETSFGRMKLADLGERAYESPSFDASTGLVRAGNVETENAKDWGFCDNVFKSGKLLFPSLLKFVAARQLSEMFSAGGQDKKAKKYRACAMQIQQAIPAVFFHQTRHDEGWLHSATEICNQPDVWGSAFAIFTGAVHGRVARDVEHALIRAFREKTAVQQGCVRQILTADTTNHGGWEKTFCPLGEYQNGGYWGTPTGWYVSAIARADHNAAADMARDYIDFLRNNLRPDGTTEASEWINPDTTKPASKHPAKGLYVATVALPYLSMKASGLI